MKTLIISAVLCLSVTILSAQEVMELDPTELTYAPFNLSTIEQEDSFSYNVNERFNGQFAEDPIAFMNAHFDIQKVIDASENKKFDSYIVTLKSKDGYLKADFDQNGNLLKTQQNFKNVVLPLALRQDMHSTYQGWTLVKTKYNAKTKGDLLVKAFYRVKLENGNKRQSLKIDARDQGIGVAVN
ncbi:hypothetical protein INR76_02130 [Marixanthomonas sp. SCSIO 43207]|uniref:hypothetical protein n=1 Tax=Marixanthomonas sp. SCSIO 43207 TaxID=2779360 RepID=UPI001CA7CC55|nr:hypothetical protein [Marixanthomonas sp. SCSIO 43207]UAB81582.1 hypothetical protein INR76_02130 [Marixanthomonas sp. SCSIO 43207]